jgi:hypothetical protein
MIQYPLHGSYSPGLMVMNGGFQLNGASAPTVLRDGTKVSSAQKMFTVARVSAGLYTVTFNTQFPLPGLPFLHASLEQAAAPTADCTVHVVKNSWSLATRSFQVQVQTVGTTPAASDADAGDRVTFLMIGAIESPGVDPA